MLLLFIAAAPLSAWISLALHEGAHVLAARLTGMRVREMRLGTGPEVFRSRLLGADVRAGLIPIGGWAQTFPPLFYRKSAMALFYAAGPAMDIAWLAVLLAAYGASRGSEAAGAMILPAIIYQGVMLWRNAVPHVTSVYGARLPNDMLSVWLMLRGGDDLNKFYRDAYLAALARYGDVRQPDWRPSGEADRIAYLLLDSHAAHRRLGDEAIEALERELSPKFPDGEQLLILEAMVWNALVRPGSRHAKSLDRWTSRALALRPDLPTLKGSRGAALAQAGRHEEALAMLAQADGGEDLNRCLSAAFQALAHFHAGRPDAAAEAFDRSLAILRSRDGLGWGVREVIAGIGAEIGRSVLDAAAH